MTDDAEIAYCYLLHEYYVCVGDTQAIREQLNYYTNADLDGDFSEEIEELNATLTDLCEHKKELAARISSAVRANDGYLRDKIVTGFTRKLK